MKDARRRLERLEARGSAPDTCGIRPGAREWLNRYAAAKRDGDLTPKLEREAEAVGEAINRRRSEHRGEGGR